MKVTTLFLVILVLACASISCAQTTAPGAKAQRPDAIKGPRAVPLTTTTDATQAVLIDELPNLKSDLAEMRAMLGVLASQESGADIRTSAALQTNRKMWQIVIARLAELTQRLDALEQKDSHPAPGAAH